MDAAEQHADTPVDQRTDGPGVTHIDPADPAAPIYRVMANLRDPLALRDIMIKPVREGYIGGTKQVDPALVPPTGAELFPDVEVTDHVVPSDAGPIRCALYRPPVDRSPLPAVLYAHGGGFMIGRSEDTDFLTRKIAVLSGTCVVSPNYRLAPEWPFPFGLDDFFAVYRWLREHGDEVGVDRRWVATAGDSSGSNFAAVVPIRAAGEGVPPPDAVVQLGPVVDFRFEDYASFREQAPTGIVYDTPFIGFLRGAYLGVRDLVDHPHVSPIRTDLSAYPPCMLVVGSHDPVVDSARAFADRLRAAGRDVELLVDEGLPHGFYFFPRVVHQEDEAFHAVARFLQRQGC